jgi:tetratricopeptide (TPR) repeat protein
MVDTANLVDAFARIAKNPKMRVITIPIYWVLWPIIKLFNKIPFVQLMKAYFEIVKLERQNKYDEARALRHAWMAKSRYSQSEILLCSEAKDLLFNKKEYEKALQTFEKVIKTNPDYNPIELYYGASCSALFTGNSQKAKEYYSKFREWWRKFEKYSKLKDRYSGCKEWLEKNIDSETVFWGVNKSAQQGNMIYRSTAISKEVIAQLRAAKVKTVVVAAKKEK